MKSTIPLWRDERVIKIVAQVVSAIIIIAIVLWLGNNVRVAADQRGLGLGFGFLDDSAGFGISETVISYDPSMTFGRALWVGILNTIRVSILGIIVATVLGFMIGIASLSSNWLLRRIAQAFVEIHRNIPLLVLLFLWYRGVFTRLPSVRNSITWPGPIYINQRGINLTWFQLTEQGGGFMAAILIGAGLTVISWLVLRKIREDTGRATYHAGVSAVILIFSAIIGWLISGGKPFQFESPALQGFNFQGGVSLTPEFAALFIGLSTYTAAFIAEIVRAGIQAVSHGQIEAARALGLRELPVLNLVVIPQALRVIIPPLISQYLNLTKNSSLAVFLGYPELFSIGKTVINQAGKAVPVFALIMAAYLVMSLVTSIVLNIYNRRVQIVER